MNLETKDRGNILYIRKILYEQESLFIFCISDIFFSNILGHFR